MADQWDDAATQFRGSGSGTPNTATAVKAHPDEDWKIWQQSSAPSSENPVMNAISHAGSKISQIPGSLLSSVIHPIDTVSGIYQQQKKLAGEGIDAAKSGDYPLAVARGVETFMPGIGPNIAEGFKTIRSGDTSGGIGDMVGGTGSMLAVPSLARASSRFANAISDPAVRDAVMPASIRNGAAEFGNAWRRAGATAVPDTPVSVANDARPMNGPVAPPPRVIRDPGQGGIPPAVPAGASRPEAFAPPRFSPSSPASPQTGAMLPSGKVVGGIQNQVETAPSPPMPVNPELPAGWSGTVQGNVVQGKTMRGAPPVQSKPASTIGTQAEMMRQQRLRDLANNAKETPAPVIFDANGNPIRRTN